MTEQNNFWVSFRSGIKLLSQSEKRRAVMLICVSVAQALLDTAALASVVPFISALVEPEVLNKGGQIAALNRFLGEPPLGSFLSITAAASIFLLVISSITGVIVQIVINRFGARCQSRLAESLMKKTLFVKHKWFLNRNHTVLARLFHNDVVIWGRDFILRGMTLIKDIMFIFFPAGVLVSMAPMVGIVALIIITMMAAILFTAIKRKTRGDISEKRRTQELTTRIASEALAGVKDIKLSCSEERFTKYFSNEYYIFTIKSARIQNWNLWPVAGLLLLGQLSMVIIAYLMWTVNSSSGEIASQIALIVLVASRIVPAANRVSNSLTSLWGVLPWIGGLVELQDSIDQIGSDKPVKGKTSRSDNWSRITTDNLTFNYPGSSIPAISNINLIFERGKSYGLVGQSGSGKTTLADMLLGLLSPTTGHIFLDDTPLENYDISAWRENIGYVPQSPFMFDETLRSNIAFGITEEQIDPQKLGEAIEISALKDLIDELPDGLNTMIGDRGIRLSGGQRQRVAIARALYRRPELLILDEATSALDPITEMAIQRALEKIHGKVTVIAIAHRLSTVRNFDRLHLLESGTIRASGRYDDLYKNDVLFNRLACGHEPVVNS